MASSIKTKIKDQLKPKEKQTLESAEAKPLTKSELAKLSRDRILEWHRKKRLGKLKALLLEISSKTPEEKEALREEIIKNTQQEIKEEKELAEKAKRIAEPEVTKSIEMFASAITSIDETPQSLEKVLKGYEDKQRREEIFFKTLDANVGKAAASSTMNKVIKENKLVASLIKIINAKNPSAMQDINIAIKEGKYDDLKKAIIASGVGISAKQVDFAFGAALTAEFGQKEYTGIKTIDKWINTLGKARYIGHTYSMKQAAKAAGVPFFLVMRLGMQTLRSVRAMDANLSAHKSLIENKENKSINDQQRLEFIEAVSKMRTTYEARIKDKEIEDRFQTILGNYLNTKKNLDEKTKAEIRANAELQDLRMFQIFDLVYAGDKERERLIFHSLARIPALTMRYYRLMVSDSNRKLRGALTSYHIQRIKNREILKFRKSAKKWNLGNILGDIDNLESELSKLQERAKGYSVDSSKKNVTADDLYKRDMIVKKYQILAAEATKAMSKEARPVIDAGKVLDNIQRSKGDIFTKTSFKSMNISPNTLRTLFPEYKTLSDNALIDTLAKKKVTGSDLVRAYSERLVDMKSMHDTTRARFAALADTIEETVEAPFQKKYVSQIEDVKTRRFRKDVTEKLDDVTRGRQVKKYGKRMILPGIILAAEAVALGSGKAKTHEVVWDLAEAAGGFVPIVGTAMDFKAAFTGRSLSGKKLSTKEQVLSAVFGVVGIVADATIVLGGAGLGIRATLGGMRGARRAIRMGKTAGALSDTAHAAKSPLGKIGHFIGSRFNKGARLESAAKATVEANALEQARLISSINEYRALKGNPIDAAGNLNEQIAKAERLMGKNPPAGLVKKVERLKELQKGLRAEINYMEILKKGTDITHTAPDGVFSFLARGTMWTKEKFLKIKTYFMKIGVPPDTLAAYEKSFDTIRDLEKARQTKINEIATLAKDKDLAEKAWLTIKSKLGKDADAAQKALLKTLEKERVLKLRHADAETAFKIANKDYKNMGDAWDYLKNASRNKRGVENLSADQLEEAAKRLKKAGYYDFDPKAPKSTLIREYKKLEHQVGNLNARRAEKQKAVDGIKGEIQVNDIKKTGWKEHFRKTNENWYKETTENHQQIMKIESELASTGGRLKDVNHELNIANQSRFMIHTELELAANKWSTRLGRFRTAAKYLQIGGMAMGGIWFITDGKLDPVTQAKYAIKAGGAGLSAGGKVLHKVYIENHASQDGLDVLIADRVNAIERKKKIQKLIEEGKKQGRSKMEILAEHSDDDGVKEIVRREGLAGKLIAFKQKARGVLPGKKDIATGDAAHKLREKIG